MSEREHRNLVPGGVTGGTKPRGGGAGSALSQVLLIVLVIGAVLCLVAGVMWLTTATLGVGVLEAGCLLGILARNLQAGLQHDERMQQ